METSTSLGGEKFTHQFVQGKARSVKKREMKRR